MDSHLDSQPDTRFDTHFDTRMMARALQLARLGKYSAMPNPHVGCVLTRDGQIIGEGHTQPAGGNHAEVEALGSVGGAGGVDGETGARGATAYVTLEPCSHHGKTGPCADALIAAGVARVVIATEDPNPEVRQRGIAALKAAGIEVETGLLEDLARSEIPGFIMRMTQGRPRVRVKLAMSLDGRTAMASGESQWITGPAARQDVQRLRAASCAILTGVGTVLADDCALTVRPQELGFEPEAAALAAAHKPLRVVLDSSGRTPETARIVDGQAPTLLCYDAAGSPSAAIPPRAAEQLAVPRTNGALDLPFLMQALGQRQCNEILVESGPRLAGSLLQAGLLDELIIYMAPTLMGDMARPLLHLPLAQMADKVALEILDVRKVGNDWRFTAIPQAATSS